MIRAVSPKLGAYIALSALGLLAALALRLPELVVLAAPFALLPALSLVRSRPPRIGVETDLEHDRALEREEVEVVVTLTASDRVEELALLLEVPRGLSTAAGANPCSLRLAPGEQRELRYRVACERWGAYLLGRIHLRGYDPGGFVTWEREHDRRRPLKVYPHEETVRGLLKPAETQVFGGNHVARQRGEGIEFADLRPFIAGDRMRRVNWRASARRGELWVNEHHPERNADVILFLDTFTEAAAGGESTLDQALRAATALAAGYLREKDRVGFVTFGGMLNWALPSTGAAQLYRIVDSLLDTQVVLNYAWKGIDVVPTRTLPPHAIVIALTPLLDERAVTALLDLRARGFDLVIVEISPLPFLREPKNESQRVARQLWRLRRDALRGRFEAAGVPVAVWDEAHPFAAALEGVTAFRRSARLVSA
jgi:uncharacterized protein (DUF58 family)